MGRKISINTKATREEQVIEALSKTLTIVIDDRKELIVALRDVVQNVREDFPSEQIEKHLRMSLDEAEGLLERFNEPTR